MADELTIRMSLQGARKAAAEAQAVGKAVGGVGDRSGKAAVQTDRLAKSSGKGRRGLLLLSSAARTGGLALGAGLALGVKHSVSAFQESRKEVAETNTLLKTTKGVANVSGKGIDSLTASLMRKTAIDDEQIRAGANMLLTFKGVRNEAGRGNKIFNRATASSVDLAAKMGTDVRGAALQLGKALNNPEKGLAKLQRSGIDFTDAEKDKIIALQKSGKLHKAQGVMLATVEGQIKGVAAGRATPIDHMNIALSELSETAGSVLSPMVDKGARSLTRFLTEAQTGTGQGGKFVTTMTRLYEEGKPVAKMFINTGVAVGKFTAKHPQLAKVAVALAGVGVAVKALRFANSATGFTSLIRGARAAPGQIRSALASTRGIVSRLMGGAGTSGGNALASTMSTTAGTNAGPAMARNSGKFSSAGRGAGRVMGKAAGIAFAAGAAWWLGNKIGEELQKNDKWRSATDTLLGRRSAENNPMFKLDKGQGSGKFWVTPKLTPKPKSKRQPIGGAATGGIIRPGGMAVVGERGPEIARNVAGKVHINPVAKPVADPRGPSLPDRVYLVLDDGTTLSGHIARKVDRKLQRA